jgi:hypothetical protein
MGGTDRFDQKLSYYRIKLRTVKWKRKVYAHVLNLVMVNIHILYIESRNLERSECGYTLLLSFQEMLIEKSAAGASQGMLYVSPAMQAPCLSRQFRRGWIISQVPRQCMPCWCLEKSAAGASQGTLSVSPAMQAPCLSRHILRASPLSRPLTQICPDRIT